MLATHSSALLSSLAGFSGGSSPAPAGWQLATLFQAHSSRESPKIECHWTTLGHGPHSESIMMAGGMQYADWPGLDCAHPGGERQGQIHQREPRRLTIEGGGDSPRKKQALLPEK